MGLFKFEGLNDTVTLKPAIIDRYIFTELLPTFFVTLVFFTFVFMMTNLLEITNLIINYRVQLSAVLKMMAFSMPFFLEFIIPMSVMMAILMTFLRMSADNEVVALKSSGVGIFRLLPPVVLFCIAGFFLTAFMSIYGLPWGKTSFKKTLLEIGANNLDIGLKERTFNDAFEGVMLFVNKVDLKSRSLQDIFIEDQRKDGVTSTIIAPKGRIFRSPERLSGHLRLFDGVIHNIDPDGRTVHSIQFETYDFQLDLKEMMTAVRDGPKDKEEMTIAELKQFIDSAKKKDGRYYSALIELHEKFAVPFACFALGLLAVPLGLQPMAGRRSVGLVLGLSFFVFYYLMLIVGWSFGESGVYPPAIGMWAPNVVISIVGLYLLIRTAKERPIRIDSMLIAAQFLWHRSFRARRQNKTG